MDGILILDADTGQLTDVNPSLVKKLGYSREELTERKLWDIGALADVAKSKERFASLLGKGFIRYEDLPLLSKDGRQIYVEFICNVFTLDGMKLVQCNVRDISDRKLEEAVTSRLKTDLELRAAELEAANRDLQAFDYMVAHELSQPLTLIDGYCQAIKMQFGDKLNEECLSYVQKANSSTLRMNRLIDALLNFSSLGRVEPRREKINLCQLSHEVAKALKQTEPERQVDFRFAKEMVADADADLLRVVLYNLLGNAWKYSRMRDKTVISFGVKDIDGVPTYFVSDNGTGFDMAYADKLFTPFQRLPGAEKSEGYGIGLATVERIIRQHGGKVWAEGERDKGACIYFTLSAN
jgi:PAS domain S-box-containing protein